MIQNNEKKKKLEVTEYNLDLQKVKHIKKELPEMFTFFLTL